VVNIGTGAFILLPTGRTGKQSPVLLSGLCSSGKHWGEYILEGTVNGAGVALDWAAQRFGIPDMIPLLSAGLGDKEEPPLFINTVGGLGSPWWQQGPDPHLVGEGGPRQKAAAVGESILFLLNANLEIMEKTNPGVRRIQVSGNLARLDGICQGMADLTLRPVYRPAETEATARGIAWLAAGRPVRWPKPGRGRVFKPKTNPSLARRYKRFIRVLAAR
jgi:glycerol kinase